MNGVPLYEFACQKCGSEFEELVSRSELKGVRCPSCRSTRVNRRVSAFYAKSSSGGTTKSLGGSSCASCTATSCAGCK